MQLQAHEQRAAASCLAFLSCGLFRHKAWPNAKQNVHSMQAGGAHACTLRADGSHPDASSALSASATADTTDALPMPLGHAHPSTQVPAGTPTKAAAVGAVTGPAAATALPTGMAGVETMPPSDLPPLPEPLSPSEANPLAQSQLPQLDTPIGMTDQLQQGQEHPAAPNASGQGPQAAIPVPNQQLPPQPPVAGPHEPPACSTAPTKELVPATQHTPPVSRSTSWAEIPTSPTQQQQQRVAAASPPARRAGPARTKSRLRLRTDPDCGPHEAHPHDPISPEEVAMPAPPTVQATEMGAAAANPAPPLHPSPSSFTAPPSDPGAAAAAAATCKETDALDTHVPPAPVRHRGQQAMAVPVPRTRGLLFLSHGGAGSKLRWLLHTSGAGSCPITSGLTSSSEPASMLGSHSTTSSGSHKTHASDRAASIGERPRPMPPHGHVRSSRSSRSGRSGGRRSSSSGAPSGTGAPAFHAYGHLVPAWLGTLPPGTVPVAVLVAPIMRSGSSASSGMGEAAAHAPGPAYLSPIPILQLPAAGVQRVPPSSPRPSLATDPSPSTHSRRCSINSQGTGTGTAGSQLPGSCSVTHTHMSYRSIMAQPSIGRRRVSIVLTSPQGTHSTTPNSWSLDPCDPMLL